MVDSRRRRRPLSYSAVGLISLSLCASTTAFVSQTVPNRITLRVDRACSRISRPTAARRCSYLSPLFGRPKKVVEVAPVQPEPEEELLEEDEDDTDEYELDDDDEMDDEEYDEEDGPQVFAMPAPREQRQGKGREGQSKLTTPANMQGQMISLEMLERTDLVMGTDNKNFRTGFVTIVGSPNVGKSTLMNSMVGDKLSIVTPKAQTTRHRIMGIVTGEDFQIIYNDTPGVLQPKYELHEGMMNFVREAVGDADVILFLTDLFEGDFADPLLLKRIAASEKPIVVAINKIDLLPGGGGPVTLSGDKLAEVGSLDDHIARWQEALPTAKVVCISAAEGTGKEDLLNAIVEHLPLSPPLYPTDTLSDRPMRFFASEIIREKVFTSMSQEIPYCSEVRLDRFKEGKILSIGASIIVARETQKGMVIGKGGAKIKEVGIKARESLEAFFDQKVHLELKVEVDKDWRKSQSSLKAYGYLT